MSIKGVMDRDPDLLHEFVTETNEHLATVEDDVLAIEEGGPRVDAERVNHLFRALHTVKGGASLLEFPRVTELAHALENVVGLVREGELAPSRAVSEALLRGIDKLKTLVADLDNDSVPVEAEVEVLHAITEQQEVQEEPPPVEPTPSPQRDPELVEQFLAEANEHLATVEDEILALERAGPQADPDTVNHLFRALHTIKGGANLLEFGRLTQLAHALENVVGAVRENEITPCRTLSDALLRGIDRLRVLLGDLGNESVPVEQEIALLDRILTTKGEAAPAEPPARDPAAPTPARPPAAAVAGPNRAAPAAPTPAATVPRPEPAAPPDTRAAKEGTKEGTVEDQTVRISLALLDRLMNLATELVLVRNQNMQAVDSGDLQQLATTNQRLNVVTSDLQASIMQTRMRPIGTVFTKFKRVVRDLAHKLGKEADLEIIGSDVELDKTIVEVIGDPLTHLVRNAVDHGLESPEERKAKGKPPMGQIRLRAFHQAGQVNVQIQDDGKGMDPARLKQAAVAKGLMREEDADALPDKEAVNLIFAPGFSTAAEVTDVSGRGVGMDVVKASFQKLGGSVDVASAVGVGTTITIKLPLTLAILPTLVVEASAHRFAIPQVNIDEVVWLHGEQVTSAIRRVDDQEVYWLRGRLLPVLRLNRVLGLDQDGGARPAAETGMTARPGSDREPSSAQAALSQDRPTRRSPGSREASLYIVVVQLGTERLGLIVDTIVDTEEIVVKPLHEQLKDCGAFAGTTVLGDGHIAMILDIAAVAELGSLRFVHSGEEMRHVRGSLSELRTVLLLSTGGKERFAIPLCLITRVEEIKADQIQIANGREYLDFRGALIPLTRVEQSIPRVQSLYPQDTLYVVIPKARRPFGILAARIEDTVEVPSQIDSGTIRQPGIAGTQLIGGRLTLFLDVYSLIETVEPDWFAAERRGRTGRVLVADDSHFSQLVLASYLRELGLGITVVNNGRDAMAALGKADFDCVISDIEMPEMDGYEFVHAVRNTSRLRALPMIGTSSSRGDIEGLATGAGFDAFVRKSDRNGLLSVVQRLLDAGSQA